MRSILSTALTVVTLCSALYAQTREDRPQSNSWRGMVINSATPDDAIRLFGKPKKDQTDRIKVRSYDSNLITDRQSEKIFRSLRYQNLPGIKWVYFDFLEGRLVLITLLYKEQPVAGALHSTYGVPFTLWLRKSTKGLNPTTLALNRLPATYDLIAQTDDTLLGATIVNATLKSLYFGSNAKDGFPGKVWIFQHISRTLLK